MARLRELATPLGKKSTNAYELQIFLAHKGVSPASVNHIYAPQPAYASQAYYAPQPTKLRDQLLDFEHSYRGY